MALRLRYVNETSMYHEGCQKFSAQVAVEIDKK